MKVCRSWLDPHLRPTERKSEPVFGDAFVLGDHEPSKSAMGSSTYNVLDPVTKWTGAVPLDEDFVVAAKLELQKNGRLDAASLPNLREFLAAMLQMNVNA